MFIRIKLPAKYGDLQSIKEENYPFNRAFREFMLSIIQISEDEGLSPYSTFGRIEHALVRGESLPLDGTTATSIDYREDEPVIVDFYKSSGYRQKETTLMFIKLLLKLSARYGNSIPEIVYLINNINNADIIDDSITTTPTQDVASIVKVRKSTTPRTDKPKTQPPVSTKAKVTTKPVKATTPKPVTTKMDTDDSNNNHSGADTLLARANKLKHNVDELSAGTEVKKNPLLNDFFDLGMGME